MEIFVSTQAQTWVRTAHSDRPATATLSLGRELVADFKGFGVCFNELGWKALSALGENAKAEVLQSLFSDSGLNLNYCRIPMGANDYSLDWYSHNDTDGDLAMQHFSIKRDHQLLIPYLRAAQAAHGAPFTLFASPWSPPAWMKTHKTFNYGTLIWQPEYLTAYADYFVRFIQAYAAEGIRIDAVHVQNEPDSDQKFPSCLWTGAKLAAFIRDYLAPAFQAAGLDTQIWLGTIERASFNDWIAPSLLDPETAKLISGVGFQWAGKGAALRTRQVAPDLPIIQTENECGDGQNTWDYAHYVFDLIRHYLGLGAQAYVYWNAVLEEGGISTWGWKQNSLFTVDTAARTYTPRPEYYVLKHFAQYLCPNARIIEGVGSMSGNAVIFALADGRQMAVLQNPLETEVTVAVDLAGKTANISLPPRSFATAIA